MNADAALKTEINAEEFLLWSQSRPDGERYELVGGQPVRLQAERVSHAERKLSAVTALRQGLRSAGLTDCRAFPDGVSVRIDDHTVREPDALIHCGPYDRDGLFAPHPVIVVEVVSPSSQRTDVDRKLIDYFAVPSILHYLIVYGDEGRVIHHRRATADGQITTSILGRESVIDLSPPGLSMTVENLLES
ncbi:Uma2 family endonuclease [Aureimonas psammosilenae]|uniref:Uma2 family endonuclease n=1 Tax=Aureimonas psammosilenae TaxID=2495496 RepID=UPI0012613150|nr:Uma2 family endonuclease [Aureimonas psammosilenae]